MHTIHQDPKAGNSAAALHYAQIGWQVFPCWPDSKSPITPNGHLDASNDPETVAKWWQDNPTANIGLNLAASGLVAVDADLYKPDCEWSAFMSGRSMPDTLTATTARGGKHYIFQAPAGADYAGKLCREVEIKHNGYIMLSPSTFEGKAYRWDNNISRALAPDWLPAKSPGTSGRIPIGQGDRAPSDVHASRALLEIDVRQVTDREDWLAITGALMQSVNPEYLEQAKSEWLIWNATYPGNQEYENLKAWNDLLKRGTTVQGWSRLHREAYGTPPQPDPAVIFGSTPPVLPAGASATPVTAAPQSAMMQPPAITDTEWNDIAALTPTCIVQNLYFADVGVRVAPGGVGKTTLALFEAMHIALGWPVFGCFIHRPGVTVILTQEDQRGMLIQRLRKLCEAAGLTPEQVATVRQNVRIQYVEQFKLTAVQGDTVVASDGVRQVIEAFGPLRPSVIWIDPAVSFGVGESRVNDAEQGLVTAGRMMRNAIPDCAVMFIHHTGKQNAREGTLDQYSGRNGSALPDGSRMVQVMKSLTMEEWREATGDILGIEETAFVIARPKLSYAPQQPHIYVKRSGWTFRTFEGQSVTNKSERARTVTVTLLRKRWERGDEVARYTAHTKLSRDDDAEGIKPKKFEEAINSLLDDGTLKISKNNRGSDIILEASA